MNHPRLYVREVSQCRECPMYGHTVRLRPYCFMWHRELRRSDQIPPWCGLERVEKQPEQPKEATDGR